MINTYKIKRDAHLGFLPLLQPQLQQLTEFCLYLERQLEFLSLFSSLFFLKWKNEAGEICSSPGSILLASCVVHRSNLLSGFYLLPISFPLKTILKLPDYKITTFPKYMDT